ncbi:MAG: sulfatase [Candidatus Undinarchaeales archaeon]
MKKKNIFLITIDAMRYDALNKAKFLKKLGKEGKSFSNCFTAGSYTPSSFCALFGGIFPLKYETYLPFPKKAKTLAEYLKENGYKTIGVPTNPFLSKFFGFNKGFSIYKEMKSEKSMSKTAEILSKSDFLYKYGNKIYNLIRPLFSGIARPFVDAEVVVEKALNLVKPDDENLFMWLHFMDTHRPYAPPNSSFSNYRVSKLNKIHFKGKDGEPISEKDLKDMKKLYHECVEHVDQKISDFYNGLPKKVRENSIFIILSDHGEEFMEHGKTGHEDLPYDELMHVPLIIHGGPKLKAKEDDLVSTIDIPKTILDYLEIKNDFEGTSLLKGANDKLYCQLRKPERNKEWMWEMFKDRNYQLKHTHTVYCERTKKKKTIDYNGKKYVFDLEKDPQEQNNLAGDSQNAR